MLAEEYILIVPFAISYISGWTNKAEQQNIISSSLTLLSSGSGLTNHRISAQQKALAVVGNSFQHFKILCWTNAND